MIRQTYRAGIRHCDQADLVRANSDIGAVTINQHQLTEPDFSTLISIASPCA